MVNSIILQLDGICMFPDYVVICLTDPVCIYYYVDICIYIFFLFTIYGYAKGSQLRILIVFTIRSNQFRMIRRLKYCLAAIQSRPRCAYRGCSEVVEQYRGARMEQTNKAKLCYGQSVKFCQKLSRREQLSVDSIVRNLRSRS